MQALALSLLLLIPASGAYSQAEGDAAFLTRAKENTIKLYDQAVGAQSRLYNGSKYRAPEHDLDEHPFFTAADWITGSVLYDGEYFEHVPLMYDLYNQVLITEHLPSGQPIQLVSEKLRQFSIDGHLFEKIENESVSNSLPKSDFYDILYPGNTKVIVRRQKFLREKIVNSIIETSYDVKTRYFIFRNGVFFPVKSKASVLKVMDDKKQELKQFLKRKQLPFSVNRELLLKELAEYYDTLK